MRSSAPFIPKGFEPLAGGKRSATPGMDAPQTSAPQRGASMSRCCDPFGIGRATRAVIRWYRFAQPPANSCKAFGIGIGIAFGIGIEIEGRTR